MCSIPDHICHVPALFSDTGRCIRVISQTSDHLRLQIFKHLPLIFWVWTLLHPSISASQDLPVLPKSLTVAGADKIVHIALTDTAGYHLLRGLCELGPRLVASEQTERAVRWAKRTMETLKLDRVRLQPVRVPRWVRGKTETACILGEDSRIERPLRICALGGSPGTPPEGIAAGVVEVQDFNELRKRKDETIGKIVFFNRPMDPGTINTFSAYGRAVEQRFAGPVEAEKAGAVGAIIRSVTTRYDNVPHVGTLQVDGDAPPVAAAAIGLRDADALSLALKNDPDLRIRMTLSCRMEGEADAFNVLGEITGSERPEEIIVVGGHFDSWDKGHGAHDDGAGCLQSLEALDLIRRAGLTPRRTIRAVFFMNEEFGFHGARVYGAYAGSSGEHHIAAIEADRGAHTPRGFYVDAEQSALQIIQSWLPILNRSLIEWIRPGGSGADVAQIKGTRALLGYVPDIQRYFDFHHSANDVFSAVHPREFELGSAAIAIMAWLLSEEDY